MDWDGKISASTLTCAASGRALAPGEVFFSGLVANPDTTFARRDFSEECWETADRAGFVSWWRQRVPKPQENRRQVKLDIGVLRKLFVDLRDIPRRPEQCLCYVVALCLVRARAFRLDAHPEGTRAELVLEDKEDHARWRLGDPGMTEADIARVQQALLSIITVGEALPQ
ncbi:MAG: hypothetical protein L6R48_01480 [Planctomycetes bacterium]|nr:hypothetical protein [Planctomycetota bacterium]